MSSIESGEIPSSPNPGISGDATLSICISSTWFRVTGGLGSISVNQANTCQAANGIGLNVGLRLASGAQAQGNQVFRHHCWHLQAAAPPAGPGHPIPA